MHCTALGQLFSESLDKIVAFLTRRKHTYENGVDAALDSMVK